MTKQLPPCPTLNRYQIAAANEYSQGNFAWIIDDQDWHLTLNDLDDDYFKFIMTELSDKEDCDSKASALQRLQAAADDIQKIYKAIEELPDDVPDPDPNPDNKRIMAAFVPQVWINNHAVTADPLGETRIDITEAVLAMTRDDTDETDDLRHLPGAPDWIDSWSGPFYVAVEADIAQYFDLLPDPESEA